MEMKKSFQLNTGASIPAIGLGTSRSEPGEVEDAVKAAIRCGYRHIDCAYIYGNQAEIGQALTQVWNETGLKREDIFITSKLWCNSHAKEDVLAACQTTLKNLQIEYLDLYLVHQPSSFVKDLVFPREQSEMNGVLGYDKSRMSETWKAMEELVRKGLCKAIGISNFSSIKVKNLLETAEIVPATNQVELHPYLPQSGLKRFCEENGILITAHTSLGSPARPSYDWVPSGPKPKLIEDPVVKEIAEKRHCSPAQVLLAWGICYGCPVLPKSVNKKRIKQNLETFNVKLEEEDMNALKNIGTKFRYLTMPRIRPDDETLEKYFDGEQ